MDKYKVTLTRPERQQLECMVSKGKAAARKLTHARILLLADESEARKPRADGEIAEVLSVGLRTVNRVRKRFVLESYEAAVSPRPRPKRPDKVKIQGKLEQQLIDLACSDPPEGRCRWTLQLLADQLVLLSHLDSVSQETVRHVLKKMIFNYGWSTPGVFRPKPTRNSSGGWRMFSECTHVRMIRRIRSFVLMNPVNN